MQPVRLDVEDLAWEAPDPPAPGERGVRWKILFSARRTPTGLISMGVAEIAPDGLLPRHRHPPAEIYYGLKGAGVVQIDGQAHRLSPGSAVFIPPHAWHETTALPSAPLRFLFMFPIGSFEDVEYRFAEE